MEKKKYLISTKYRYRLKFDGLVCPRYAVKCKFDVYIVIILERLQAAIPTST